MRDRTRLYYLAAKRLGWTASQVDAFPPGALYLVLGLNPPKETPVPDSSRSLAMLDEDPLAAVPPFTLTSLIEAWKEACVKAWDGDHAVPSAVLPEGVLPGAEFLTSHVTYDVVKIRRIPMFIWDRRQKAEYVTASPGMTPGQIRELQDTLNAVAAGQGWQGRIIVLPPGTRRPADGTA